jgi:ribose 5-phosphate isomerase A
VTPPETTPDLRRLMTGDHKRSAALKALELVRDGMRLGLGTGSTAAMFVDALGERVAGGLKVTGVATSEATRRQAERLGIALVDLDDTELDLTVDGADEIDGDLNLIKGGGGALTREKIVAASSRRMIVVADASKQVKTLGRFPLPVEIVPFGAASTVRRIGEAARPLAAPARSRAPNRPRPVRDRQWQLDRRLPLRGDQRSRPAGAARSARCRASSSTACSWPCARAPSSPVLEDWSCLGDVG